MSSNSPDPHLERKRLRRRVPSPATERNAIEKERHLLVRIVLATVLATIAVSAVAFAAALAAPAAAGGGPAAEPAAAPAGIVFTRHVRGARRADLFAATEDRRTEDVAQAWRPAVAEARAAAAAAGDGLIAFARRTGTGVSALYVVRPDGSGLRRLSSQPVDYDPAWTPDGRRLVFASSRGGRAGAPELYSRDLAGRSVVRLTRTPATSDDWSANGEPAVAADGRRIVFVRERNRAGATTRDLYSVPVGGGPLRQLTRTAEHEASPSLGRSGALYFERDGWILEQMLGTTRRVARGVQPAKDPSRLGLVAFARAGAIYVTDGGAPEKVAAGTGAGGLSDPAWSPDGRRLAYVGPDGLYVVDRDGGNRRRLTTSPPLAHDVSPVWRPIQRTSIASPKE